MTDNRTRHYAPEPDPPMYDRRRWPCACGARAPWPTEWGVTDPDEVNCEACRGTSLWREAYERAHNPPPDDADLVRFMGNLLAQHEGETIVALSWDFLVRVYALAFKQIEANRDQRTTVEDPRSAFGWLRVLQTENPAKFRDVHDPDGWRRGDGVTMDTPITRADFTRRYSMCTLGTPGNVGGWLGRYMDQPFATEADAKDQSTDPEPSDAKDQDTERPESWDEGLPVDLREDGLLWLINRVVFHPRGFALAVHSRTGAFTLLGDGHDPWRFGGDPPTEDERFARAEAAFARAREHDAEHGPSSVEGHEHEYGHTAPRLLYPGDPTVHRYCLHPACKHFQFRDFGDWTDAAPPREEPTGD